MSEKVTPSRYLPTDQTLQVLAMALAAYAADPETREKMDTTTVTELALKWSQSCTKVKVDPAGNVDNVGEMAEDAHMLILAILRDVTILSTMAIGRGLQKGNIFSAKQEEAAKASEETHETDFDSERAEIIGNSVRSAMSEGYNLPRFVEEYTEHGENLRISQADWDVFTHRFKGDRLVPVTAIEAWYGSKFYEIHYHGENLPVEVFVTERASIQ